MPGAGRPTRYAIVGAGGRSSSYLRGLLAEPAGTAVLAGVIDPNRGRAERLRAMADGTTSSAAVLAGPDGLESVIAAQEIDRVIVCSPDWTHADLVARTLRAGADAVVEKPLTIDDEGCRTVAAAIAETGRDVVAAFNYRYAPRSGAVRSLLAAGEIGTVTSIHFEWMLDTSHGADYFRRWHRDKTKSGGLLVHKASHHFDLVNW